MFSRSPQGRPGPAGVDFDPHLPNYTFKRCQISKTSPPSQSKHLGEQRSRRGWGRPEKMLVEGREKQKQKEKSFHRVFQVGCFFLK